jgi:hypothetical protein
VDNDGWCPGCGTYVTFAVSVPVAVCAACDTRFATSLARKAREPTYPEPVFNASPLIVGMTVFVFLAVILWALTAS